MQNGLIDAVKFVFEQRAKRVAEGKLKPLTAEQRAAMDIAIKGK